jgi:hypothetical protein
LPVGTPIFSSRCDDGLLLDERVVQRRGVFHRLVQLLARFLQQRIDRLAGRFELRDLRVEALELAL